MNELLWLLASWLSIAAAGVWLMLQRRGRWSHWFGFLLLLIGGLGTTFTFGAPTGPLVPVALLWLFGGGALLCGTLMITSPNPVHSALWFALSTLSVCGLFLMQDAPFLAAATIIVYAGAIIVTFLFVIMLARQRGSAAYDPHLHQPLLATMASFILLAALLTTLRQPPPAPLSPTVAVHSLSRPDADQPLGTMHGLGRALFGDYLFAVELAGTLLLIAGVGAIAMAPRREQGTL